VRTSGAAVLLAAALAFPGSARAVPDRPAGWVSDFADILDDASRDQVSRLIAGVETQTSAEIAVVTVPSLDGLAIEDYAIKLAEKWKVGKKGKDNGVILLVAPAEHKVWIAVGYGLEPRLTDGVCGGIIRAVLTPAFKRGDYAGGIRDGVQAIADVVEGRPAPAGDSPMVWDQPFASRASAGFIIGALVLGLGIGFLTQGFRAGWIPALLGVGAWLSGWAGLRRAMPSDVALAMSAVMGMLGWVLANAKRISRQSQSGTGFWAGFGGTSGSSSGGWGGGGGSFGGFGGGSFGGGGAGGSW
jgi:uncharacterized protein